MTSLAQILEGDDFAPPAAAPAADTSAFSGPAAGPPTPGDFLDQIAEQIFDHLAVAYPEDGGGDTDAIVDEFLAELRQRLIVN